MLSPIFNVGCLLFRFCFVKFVSLDIFLYSFTNAKVCQSRKPLIIRENDENPFSSTQLKCVTVAQFIVPCAVAHFRCGTIKTKTLRPSGLRVEIV
jgi:hypothetical protein